MSRSHGAVTPAAAQERKATFAIHRILCPVDFSEESRRALEIAVAIARSWGSQLEVLHVYQEPSPFDVVPPVDETAPSESGVDVRRAALQNFVKPIAGDIAVTFRVRHGTAVGRPIVKEAETIEADLLVIGSHGRGGVERFLLGSTSDAVVKKATCAVLVVPPNAGPAHDGRFRRILCAIDFSAPSLQAFRYAVHLGSPADGELTLLHAIEMPPELRDRQIVAAFDVDAVRAATENAVRRRLEALAPGDDAPAARMRAEVVVGPAHRQIVEVARQQHADLIVLGTHGRSAFDRWVFGSNTRAVLRDAPCPVLTVAPA